MTNYLPSNASLENLKKQAKALLKQIRSGDEQIITKIHSHPRFRDREPDSLRLADCQALIALGYGFNNWAELKRSLDGAEGQLEDDFLRAAVLRYGGSFEMNIAKARQLWLDHPSLDAANIWTAAACGNHEAIAKFLDQQPELVNQKGGPYDDTPLLYVCYSRAQLGNESHGALETARMLLDHGADANAYYFTHGTYQFSCITGAIGEGENGPVMCPPHPQARDLVKLLLDHGADPNDGQGLYNSMFTGGTHWLHLLLQHGLKQGDRINWDDKGPTTLDFLLAHAANKNMLDRVELLLQHGADPNCLDSYEKKPVYETAMSAGNTEVLDLLVKYGAQRVEPATSQEAFYNACMAVDRGAVDRLRSEHGDAQIHSWSALGEGKIGNAAAANKIDAVRWMLDLGFPIGQALFSAAWDGRLEIARLLVEHGARADERHPQHSVTPIAFADRSGKHEVVAYLMQQEIDIFDAIRFGDVARVESVLAAKPEALQQRYRDYTSARSDWSDHTPLQHAMALGKDEIAQWLRNAGAE